MDIIAPSVLERPSYGKIFPMFYLHDEDKLARGLPDIHQAIENIRSYSSVGATILNWAEFRKIGFQLADDLPLQTVAVCARNNAGTGEQRRRCNLRFSRQYELNGGFSMERIIAHELMHGVQHIEHDLLANDIEYGLHDYIMSSLCAEAAAETMASLVCFEMAGRGFAAPFEQMLDAGRLDRHYHTHHRKFGRVYNDAMLHPHHDGVLTQQALAAACSESFHSYITNPAMVQVYGASCLEKYANGIASGLFDGRPAKRQGFTARLASDYARITEDFTLVDQVVLPKSFDDIFGGNKRMRQFAEALDYHRDCRSFTPQEMATTREELERAGNPFLDMDIKEFWAEVEPKLAPFDEQAKGVMQSHEASIVRLASAWVELDDVFQLHLPFDKDDAHAPNQKAQSRIRAQSMPRVRI